MRRHYIWYCLALAWAIAAIVGLFLHHSPQAMPAALFALLFAIIGIAVGRRDNKLRRQRTPRFR